MHMKNCELTKATKGLMSHGLAWLFDTEKKTELQRSRSMTSTLRVEVAGVLAKSDSLSIGLVGVLLDPLHHCERTLAVEVHVDIDQLLCLFCEHLQGIEPTIINALEYGLLGLAIHVLTNCQPQKVILRAHFLVQEIFH